MLALVSSDFVNSRLALSWLGLLSNSGIPELDLRGEDGARCDPGGGNVGYATIHVTPAKLAPVAWSIT